MERKTEKLSGIFNGQQMEGEDGRTYPVPQNYASKSKLISGDKLLLSTNDNGFFYRRTEAEPSKRVFGRCIQEEKLLVVEVDSIKYKVLPSVVAFFKLKDGDDVIAIVPKERETEWAMVEGVVTKNKTDEF